MPDISKKLAPIFKKYPVICAYLFGSRATGKTRAISDFDIAIFFDWKMDKKKRGGIAYDIKEEIEKQLKAYKNVDIVPLNDAQPLLEHEVVYKGKRIYSGDDGARAHYEARAISRWLDWKFHQDKHDKAVKERMGKPVISN